MKKLFLMLSVIVFCMKVSFADSTCIRFPGMGESVFTRPTLSNHINTAHFKVHFHGCRGPLLDRACSKIINRNKEQNVSAIK